MHWLVFERKWRKTTSASDEWYANWFHLRSMLLWAEIVLFYTVFTVTFFTITDTATLQIVAAVLTGLHFVYMAFVMAYFLYQLCYYYKFPAPLYGWVPLFELAIMYTIIVTQYQLLYISTLLLFPDSFVGLSTNLSKFFQYSLSLYFSAETLTALGTGVIFANIDSNAKMGFFAVQAESTITWAGFLLFGTYTVLKVHRFNAYQERLLRKKKPKSPYDTPIAYSIFDTQSSHDL